MLEWLLGRLIEHFQLIKECTTLKQKTGWRKEKSKQATVTKKAGLKVLIGGSLSEL